MLRQFFIIKLEFEPINIIC